MDPMGMGMGLGQGGHPGLMLVWGLVRAGVGFVLVYFAVYLAMRKALREVHPKQPPG